MYWDILRGVPLNPEIRHKTGTNISHDLQQYNVIHFKPFTCQKKCHLVYWTVPLWAVQ